MRQSIIRMAATVLALCLTLAFAAAEDMEITLEDTGVIFEEVSYDDVAVSYTHLRAHET